MTKKVRLAVLLSLVFVLLVSGGVQAHSEQPHSRPNNDSNALEVDYICDGVSKTFTVSKWMVNLYAKFNTAITLRPYKECTSGEYKSPPRVASGYLLYQVVLIPIPDDPDDWKYPYNYINPHDFCLGYYCNVDWIVEVHNHD